MTACLLSFISFPARHVLRARWRLLGKRLQQGVQGVQSLSKVHINHTLAYLQGKNMSGI